MADETPQQYMARILGFQAGRDPNKILATTPKKLEKLLRGKSRARLTKRPSPKRWSVAEIMAHLADTELVIGYRLRTILGNPGTPIQAFDQDSWASAGRYNRKDPMESLKTFSAIRRANLAVWKALKPAEWKLYGQHSERGQETIEKIWRHDAGHDLNHMTQIIQILGSTRTAKKRPK